MPTFEIEQYEVCATTYRVEAASEAEAIAKLFDGGGEVIDNSHDFIEVADRCGLAADEHPQLAEELRKLGVPVQDVIPSIRAIEETE